MFRVKSLPLYCELHLWEPDIINKNDQIIFNKYFKYVCHGKTIFIKKYLQNYLK